MKKEQILLVAALGVAALVVWANSGLYAAVGAADVREGQDIDVTATVPADPLRGVDSRDPPQEWRSLLEQTRLERRPEPPKLDLPPQGPYPWVRPLPWPSLPAALWNLLREPMASVAKPAAAPPDTASQDVPEEEEDPSVVAQREAEQEKEKERQAAAERIARAAKLVSRDGREKAVRLIPLGAQEGQPVWSILENWQTGVRFLVEELNADGRTVLGRYELTIAPGDERYQTVHLEKTLENEYHEERIRRGVKPTDREANVQFAVWIRQVLVPKYGVPAVRFALTHLMAAKAIQADAALIALIGETCQEAFDLDEEIRQYLDYLQGARANETAIIVRLGEAYLRGGAVHAALAQFEKAATLGDAEGRLRMAQVRLGLAQSPADVAAVYDEFAKSTAPAVRGRALAGMAQIRLREGKLAEAVQHGAEARQADPASFDAAAIHGVALYASGKFTEAEQAFLQASLLERPVESGGGTRGKSNRAMALLALDKLPEAIAEAEACLAKDALNFFDPLVVIGEAQQRWGDVNKSNDTFETAALRHPRNPWILLRLAAIRLRDGLPGRARDVVLGTKDTPGLLQLVPESVDALHLAALTVAAQEPADWPAAVKYLRRAVEKEPRNVALVYELGRALHLAGRSEEALAVLQRATEPNSGFARSDARCLALLAYVQFESGKGADAFYATVARGRQAQHGDWTKAWLDAGLAEVNLWDRTRVYRDDFSGIAKGSLGGGWKETDAQGISIQGDGSAAVFRGKLQSSAAERKLYTGMQREEALQPLDEVSFELRVPEGATNFEFVAHLWAGELPSFEMTSDPKKRGAKNAAEIGIGRSRDGQMRLYVYAAGGAMFNVAVKDESGTERAWPNDGAVHRVTIRRAGTDATRGQFEILLDGEPIPTPAPIEVGQLSAQFNKNAVLGVHVDADPGAEVLLFVEAVEIVRVTGKR